MNSPICSECGSNMEEDGYCVICDHLPKKESNWITTSKVKLDYIIPRRGACLKIWDRTANNGRGAWIKNPKSIKRRKRRM